MTASIPVIIYARECNVSEELLYRAAAQGMKYIRLAPDALVTPLARDVAWEKGIELVSADGRKEWR